MTGVAGAVRVVTPIGGGRTHRLIKAGLWIAGSVVLLVALNASGIDIAGWLDDLWDTLTSIGTGYLVAAVILQTAQTALTALAWLAILRAAYPNVKLGFAPILTAYAVAVALNNVLPANLGTLVMLFMFIAIVPGSTFAGVFSGYLVHKIFFTVIGGAVYVYLFLSVPGSFSIELGSIADHPLLWIAIAGGVAFLIVLGVRALRPRVQGLWDQAKDGGQILGTPRLYVTRVLLPQIGAYAAKLGVIAIFLTAYGIPATFHTIMTVVGGNSVANVVSVTPGGVGVNQAMNAAALHDVTDAQTATAYSIAQQLVTTAWNILFAAVLVVIVFGWTGGRALVSSSYSDAKQRAGELRKRKGAEDSAAVAES